MIEPEEKFADDSEAAERARRRAKLPPTAPLMRRFIGMNVGMSRKERRRKAAKMAKAGVMPLPNEAKPITAEPIKGATVDYTGVLNG